MKEARIAKILHARSFGTPAPNIRYLESLDLSVTYGQMSFPRLRAYMQGSIPCILFVQASELPYSESEGFHAIVVVGLSEQVAYVNDPALDAGPQSVPLDYIRLAWSEFEYKGAVITSR